MSIVEMPLSEGLAKGYKLASLPQPYRSEPTFFEVAGILGREIVPAIAGSIIGIPGGPAGIAAGGAVGSAGGNYWSQQYRIARGLQSEVNTGELFAATAIGAIPLSALPGKSALARTTIRGAQGAGLATGELAARTYIDEGRAPTSDEVATTLLFGGVFGGALGSLEAKFLNNKLGPGFEKNMDRPAVQKQLEKIVTDAGGPANYESTSPIGLRTFDQQGLPGTQALPGPTQRRIEPRKTGSDAVVDIEAMDVADYADGVLKGLEGSLSKGVGRVVTELAQTDVPVELQGLKRAFEAKIAGDSEVFTGVNSIIAKGDLAATRRLREIEHGIETLGRENNNILVDATPRLRRLGSSRDRNKLRKLIQERDKLAAIPTLKAKGLARLNKVNDEISELQLAERLDDFGPEAASGVNPSPAKVKANRVKREKLEAERDKIASRFGRLQSPAVVGLASAGAALTTAEEEELRDIGPWAIGLGAMVGMSGVGKGGRLASAKKFFSNIFRGTKKGKEEAAQEAAKEAEDVAQRQVLPAQEAPPQASPQQRKPVQSVRGGKERTLSEAEQRKLGPTYFSVKMLLDDIIKGEQLTKEGEAAIYEISRRVAKNPETAQSVHDAINRLPKSKRNLSDKAIERFESDRSRHLSDMAIQGMPFTESGQVFPKVRSQDLTRQTNESILIIRENERLQEFPNQETLNVIDEEIKKRIAARPKAKRFYEKAGIAFPVLLASGVSLGGIVSMLDDPDVDNEFKKSDMGGVIMLMVAAMLGKKGWSKYIKTKNYKKLRNQAHVNPVKVEPDVMTHQSIKVADEKMKSAYVAPSEFQRVGKSIAKMLNQILVPMSRNLKNISETIAASMRRYEGATRRTTVRYMDQASPYIEMMTKKLGKNSPKFAQFKFHLLSGNFEKIKQMNVTDAEIKAFNKMEKSLNDFRNYARTEGGIDVGYVENYFPREVKDYTSFKKYLDENLSDRDLRTSLDKELDAWANKMGYPTKDLIPEEEFAHVASRVLRGYPVQPGASLPPNFQNRSLQLDREMLDAYADPADSLKTYIERGVEAVERRKFLYRKPSGSAKDVGFEGSRDRMVSDLGSDMQVDDSIAGSIAERMGIENNLDQEDIEKLRSIISSRFSGQTVPAAIQGLKNANYIQVMGNFGSAITQLAELAYSVHFNGAGNTFRSLFNRKENFNFTKLFGLQDHNIDSVTSAGGLSKALDKVFEFTQLKRLDQLSKNTIMNASWRKYQALAKKDGAGLVDELTPTFGPERARLMVNELRDSNPRGGGQPPENALELIWYKFLDLNPATLGEMPAAYANSGALRIAYMLKTFTIKQFDVYQEVAMGDIKRAKTLLEKGQRGPALKAATDGVMKLSGLLAIFGAANAGTDIIKDKLYGRPTKVDETIENNLYKLIGINRYLIYKSKRDGPAMTTLEYMLPPTAIFDRAYKDIIDITGDGEYKGNMLQGTPLDLVYWKYLGGLDKIESAK